MLCFRVYLLNTSKSHIVLHFRYNVMVLFLLDHLVQAWSNKRIHSCYHRVTMRGSRTRISVALFTFCKGVIHVPDELIDEEHPLHYKPFNHREFLTCLSNLLQRIYSTPSKIIVVFDCQSYNHILCPLENTLFLVTHHNLIVQELSSEVLIQDCNLEIVIQ